MDRPWQWRGPSGHSRRCSRTDESLERSQLLEHKRTICRVRMRGVADVFAAEEAFLIDGLWRMGDKGDAGLRAVLPDDLRIEAPELVSHEPQRQLATLVAASALPRRHAAGHPLIRRWRRRF